MHFFYPKDCSRKKIFLLKKVSFIEFIRFKQKNLLKQRQQFCRKTMSVCRRKHWGSFFVKKHFFLLFSHQTVLGLERSTFCSAVKTSFEVTGWNCRRVFLMQKRTFQCFLSDIQPENSGFCRKTSGVTVWKPCCISRETSCDWKFSWSKKILRFELSANEKFRTFEVFFSDLA